MECSQVGCDHKQPGHDPFGPSKDAQNCTPKG